MFPKTRDKISLQASIAAGLSLLIVLLLVIIGIDTKKVADKVVDTRISIDARLKQSRDVTRLRGEAELAKPKTAVLEDILPLKDELFAFPGEIEELGSENNVTANFNFGSEGNGMIGYSITLRGAYDNAISFIEALRDEVPFMNLTSFNIVAVEGSYTTNLEGNLFFKDEEE